MLTRILVDMSAASVLWIEPGSVEVSDENRTKISSELVEGRWLRKGVSFGDRRNDDYAPHAASRHIQSIL